MKKMFLIILRLFIASIFLFSAISKLVSLDYFEHIILNYQIIKGDLQIMLFTRVLISLELFLGVSFLQTSYLKKLIVPFSLLMIVLFSLHLMVQLIVNGNTANCGCFGSVIEITSLEALIKNTGLIIIHFYLYFNLLHKIKNKMLIVFIILAVCIGFVFAFYPIKTKERPIIFNYTEFQGKEADLSHGEKILAVFSAGCDDCQKTLSELKELDQNYDLPEIYLLIYNETAGSVEDGFLLSEIRYPYHEITAQEFFSLIGAFPPRIYWLKNGQLRAAWDEGAIEQIRKKLL